MKFVRKKGENFYVLGFFKGPNNKKQAKCILFFIDT